jgi:hypothetical protein
MNIVRVISFETVFLNDGNFKSISTDDETDGENRYMIYLNELLAGSVSVSENEIKKINFKIGIDEEYVLRHTLRILERKASVKRLIRFYVYADSDHTAQLEKLGFIKRKRFFDSRDRKYFKMFKIV